MGQKAATDDRRSSLDRAFDRQARWMFCFWATQMLAIIGFGLRN